MTTTILILIWFWIQGAGFYCGIAHDNTRGWTGLIITIVALITWPLLLGCEIREKMGWRDDAQQSNLGAAGLFGSPARMQG